MKKQAILLIFIFVLLTSFTSSYAQLKFAHINFNELIAAMPESDSVTGALETLNQEYTRTGEELQVEYNIANEEFQKGQAGWSDVVRQTKQAALSDMVNRIQQFVADSRQDLQNKQQELLQPILIKAQNTIQEVSDEQGYDYVFDTGTGAILTVPKDKSYDIMPLVLKKLGLETQ